MAKTNGKENGNNDNAVEMALQRITLPPETGVFGQLQVQMKATLSELAIERMNLLSELVQTEKATNDLIRKQWIPAAQKRKSLYENLGVQQGFVEVNNEDVGPVDNAD